MLRHSAKNKKRTDFDSFTVVNLSKAGASLGLKL